MGSPVPESFSCTRINCCIPSFSNKWSLQAGLRNFPRISSRFDKKRLAARSIIPDPQMPMGVLSSMVWTTRSFESGSIHTRSITPGFAVMPILLTPPSSAGPAAPAQAISQSLLPTTISALVPTSTMRQGHSFLSRSEKRMPAIKSPPK